MQFFRHPAFRYFLSFIAGSGCALAALMLFVDSASKPAEDASLRVLKQRLEELAPLSAKQQRLLADEMLRVRKFEKRLRRRAAALDALLNDTLDLEPNSDAEVLDGVYFEESAEGSGDGAELGIGGPIEPLTPVLSYSPRLTPSVVRHRRFPKQIFEYPQDTLRLLDEQVERLSAVPLGVPTRGSLSSGYGHRRSPFSRRISFHRGIDYAAESRSAVVATAQGVVREAGWKRGYGLTVVVDHLNGFKTVYAHLSRLHVQAGEKVCRGKTIGLVGSTGRSTGPHVHYEVRRAGKPIDPRPFVELASFLRFI